MAMRHTCQRAIPAKTSMPNSAGRGGQSTQKRRWHASGYPSHKFAAPMTHPYGGNTKGEQGAGYEEGCESRIRDW